MTSALCWADVGRIKTIADEELLAVARRVFQERGHAAATREVAREAGVSQAVLYQRFGSKEDLFFAAMLPPPPDLEAILGDEAEAAADTLGHLTAVAERVLAYFESVTPVMLHLITHPAFDAAAFGRVHDRVPAAHIVGALAGRIRALEGRGLVGAVDAHAAANAIVTSMHTLAMVRFMAGPQAAPSITGMARDIVGALWSGLAPRG